VLIDRPARMINRPRVAAHAVARGRPLKVAQD
jgi:hypothetical protein